MDKYDLIVIGSGPGGYVAAVRAAQLGMKTAIVEKRKTVGGTCLNVGCIPSKALLYSSEQYAFLQKSGKEHGIEVKAVTVNFPQMMKRKEEAVESLVNGVSGLLKRNQVELIEGEGKFVSAEELVVGKNRYSSKHFLLATGSVPTSLPFLPFDEKQVLSSTGALNLSQIPKKMIVIGAGVIGVELASVYCRLGTEVILIEMLDQICPTVDRQVGKALQQTLAKQGLKFHLGAKVLSGEKEKKGVELKVKLQEGEETFKTDVVLVAVGRKPYTEGLGLEQIGVKNTARGFVEINQTFCTAVPHILAIGDLVEGPMLAHKASEEGVAAVEWLAGLSPKINYLTIPNVIYTHPEVATVGLTEDEVKGLGGEVLKGVSYMKGNPRARCVGESDGLIKVVGDQKSGKVLGVHILAPAASEMIGEGVAALQKRMKMEDLAEMSHAHPTFLEGIKEAALQALDRPLHG